MRPLCSCSKRCSTGTYKEIVKKLVYFCLHDIIMASNIESGTNVISSSTESIYRIENSITFAVNISIRKSYNLTDILETKSLGLNMVRFVRELLRVSVDQSTIIKSDLHRQTRDYRP